MEKNKKLIYMSIYQKECLLKSLSNNFDQCVTASGHIERITAIKDNRIISEMT